MDQERILSYIAELERQIATLPVGSISTKKIKGKEYFYRRWTENKKRREKYIPMDEVECLREQIQQRKALETELKEFRKKIPGKTAVALKQDFITNVRIGESLRAFFAPVLEFKKREGYQELWDYICGKRQDKVFILYGLRRTGKTTMIRQALAELSKADISKAAFIQITAKNTLADVNRDLKRLEELGCRYIFMDEVTLMEDFIEGAALFSDVFAACGMKIVLSGMDSLGFLFAGNEELYDRCIFLRTTFIPYREFETVFGIQGIDEYIRYGGTMSLGGGHYNETSTFASKESTDEYVDAAVAKNIQHSLRCYPYEGRFRHLQELYEKNEWTSIINHVVEEINHRFMLEVLARDFDFQDLSFSARSFRRNRTNPADILERIDIAAVTERLRNLLEVRNQSEGMTALDESHGAEIREYLRLLDLIQEIDIVCMPHMGRKAARIVVSQPGLRYAQTDALMRNLLMDEGFGDLSFAERKAVLERILKEIKGWMMQDIVLLETQTANPKKQVFVLQFPAGEFDMVVFDPDAGCCEIFAIKHSTERMLGQLQHLLDKQKCLDTEHRYGKIVGKYVLYCGESRKIGDVEYWNVEEYLRGLKG